MRSAQIHFRDYPKDVLLQWQGDQTLRTTFMNSLKVRPGALACVCLCQ